MELETARQHRQKAGGSEVVEDGGLEVELRDCGREDAGLDGGWSGGWGVEGRKWS